LWIWQCRHFKTDASAEHQGAVGSHWSHSVLWGFDMQGYEFAGLIGRACGLAVNLRRSSGFEFEFVLPVVQGG
jgi:hypothetical protein